MQGAAGRWWVGSGWRTVDERVEAHLLPRAEAAGRRGVAALHGGAAGAPGGDARQCQAGGTIVNHRRQQQRCVLGVAGQPPLRRSWLLIIHTAGLESFTLRRTVLS